MSDAKVSFHGEDWEEAAPGAEAFFSFACPVHKGRRCELLTIRREGSLRPSWEWDGNREAPTFEPSVNHQGCWHGYIRGGRCVNVPGQDEPEP